MDTEVKEGERGGKEAEGERRVRGKGGGDGERDEETDVESDGVMDGMERKQAVLTVAFRYLDTYRELLQEEGERSICFPKVIYATFDTCHTLSTTIFFKKRKQGRITHIWIDWQQFCTNKL